MTDDKTKPVTNRQVAHRKSIAEYLQEETGIPQMEARAIVNSFYNKIIQALEEGKAVKLHGFGKLQPVVRKERLGRNPKTGKQYEIPSRVSVRFQPGTSVKRWHKDIQRG